MSLGSARFHCVISIECREGRAGVEVQGLHISPLS